MSVLNAREPEVSGQLRLLPASRNWVRLSYGLTALYVTGQEESVARLKCPWNCNNGWQPRRRRDGTATMIQDQCGGCKGRGYIIVDNRTGKHRPRRKGKAS